MSDVRNGVPSWPLHVEIPVAWGDMDAFKHVNNTVFLRWFETARIAFLQHVGLLASMEKTQVGPILARATVDFRLPVSFPDTIRCEAAVSSVGKTSWVLAYRAWSQKQRALVAQGDSVLVLFDYQNRAKVALEGPLRKRIAALERAVKSL